jgi:hypothetical protein
MSSTTRRILYIILVILALLAFYSIFNAGNPRSIFRIIVKDPSYDLAITVVLSGGVAVIAFIVSTGSGGKLAEMLQMNAEYIRQLRKQGKSDDYIAEDFLKTLGSKKGFLHGMAKQRVLKFLRRLD